MLPCCTTFGKHRMLASVVLEFNAVCTKVLIVRSQTMRLVANHPVFCEMIHLCTERSASDRAQQARTPNSQLQLRRVALKAAMPTLVTVTQQPLLLLLLLLT